MVNKIKNNLIHLVITLFNIFEARCKCVTVSDARERGALFAREAARDGGAQVRARAALARACARAAFVRERQPARHHAVHDHATAITCRLYKLLHTYYLRDIRLWVSRNNINNIGFGGKCLHAPKIDFGSVPPTVDEKFGCRVLQRAAWRPQSSARAPHVRQTEICDTIGELC